MSERKGLTYHETKHLCAAHFKVWLRVNPRYTEKYLHSFMFTATIFLPTEISHKSKHVGLIHPTILCKG